MALSLAEVNIHCGCLRSWQTCPEAPSNVLQLLPYPELQYPHIIPTSTSAVHQYLQTESLTIFILRHDTWERNNSTRAWHHQRAVLDFLVLRQWLRTRQGLYPQAGILQRIMESLEVHRTPT